MKRFLPWWIVRFGRGKQQTKKRKIRPERNDDEWDRYEWLHLRNVEIYAREMPSDPDVPDLVERIRSWRDIYLRWGRDTLGFGLYLFQK